MLKKRLAEKRTANHCIVIYKNIRIVRLCCFVPTDMRDEQMCAMSQKALVLCDEMYCAIPSRSHKLKPR